MCDLHPDSLFKVWRSEQCRVLCVPRVPGSGYLWKVQESTPGLVYWAGRSQRAQEGARSRKHAEYVPRAPVIMRTLKSNRITTSKDFSISSVDKGTDQTKVQCECCAWVPPPQGVPQYVLTAEGINKIPLLVFPLKSVVSLQDIDTVLT